jgi:MYXO-CTERM domain-containing protein
MFESYQLHGGETLGPAARERARVREHLAGAEHSARRRRVRLDPLAASCRALLLGELSRYRRRGRFPRHPDRRGNPVPQFIDEHGTRCAVAHLMEVSGQGALVRHIAQTENAARVHALARLPELRAWLSAAGFSLDEAARIQPAYCYFAEADACFCQGWPGLAGVAVGTVVTYDDEFLRVRMDQLYGDLVGRLTVGEERLVTDDDERVVEVGAQVFVGHLRDDTNPSALALERIAPLLTSNGISITCNYNSQTAERPLSVTTAVEALLADHNSRGCIDVLASDDGDWNQRECDGYNDVAQESGCSVTHPGGGGLTSGELTSAALLLALLLHRRQRR